jgi:hypothetical protein
LCGAEYSTTRKVIRCTRNVLKCGVGERWKDCGRNTGLHKSNVERNFLQIIKRRKANWIGHIWHRNCLLKHVIPGKIQGRVD